MSLWPCKGQALKRLRWDEPGVAAVSVPRKVSPKTGHGLNVPTTGLVEVALGSRALCTEEHAAELQKSKARSPASHNLPRCQQMHDLHLLVKRAGKPLGVLTTTRGPCLRAHGHPLGLFWRLRQTYGSHFEAHKTSSPRAVAPRKNSRLAAHCGLPALVLEQVWHEVEPFLHGLRSHCHDKRGDAMRSVGLDAICAHSVQPLSFPGQGP
mmetsp:Transcript_55235/g.128862  ORF Transcript_55235/g.128862 Transcript_55235/m.128862 type:complete len:209 (-) Transcript_55235:2-628(-)